MILDVYMVQHFFKIMKCTTVHDNGDSGPSHPVCQAHIKLQDCCLFPPLLKVHHTYIIQKYTKYGHTITTLVTRFWLAVSTYPSEKSDVRTPYHPRSITP